MCRNKRVYIIILSAVFIITLICIIINLCFNSVRLKTEEEIIEIFNDNKENFIISADKLFQFQYHWDLRRNKYSDAVLSDWQFVNLNSGLQLIILDADYFNEISIIQNVVEEEKAIKYIMKGLNFKIITTNAFADLDCLYFVKQTTIGFDSGIIYSPNKTPENPYITKLTELDSSWYYYECKG